MKKKGFTLVEVVAVMAIMSVVLLSVGGLYVTGIKRTQDTKINNDIENEYRNTYQLAKNQIQDSDNILTLKSNKVLKTLGIKINFNNTINELQGLTADKAYILTKDNNSNIDTILASFRKDGSDELKLYILYVDNANIDENEIKQNKDALNLKNISRVREVCDDLKEISIDEAENGFNFKLDYLKNRIQRSYEFYISKDDNNLNISSVPEKLVEFYDNIASLTVFNPENNDKAIRLTDASIRLSEADKNYPSFFIKDVINNSGNKVNSNIVQFENDKISNPYNDDITNVEQFINSTDKIGENEGSISYLRNNNNGSEKFQPLDLKFTKADKDIIITGSSEINENEIGLKKILNNLGNKDCVLIKINKKNKVELEKISIKDDNKNKMYNFNDYVGAIMNIGDNKCTILINGNLKIKSLNQSDLIFKDHRKDQKSVDGMLIYSSGSLDIEGNTSVERTSFVVNDGINITGSLDIKGQYTLTGEKRNLISTFLNND